MYSYLTRTSLFIATILIGTVNADILVETTDNTQRWVNQLDIPYKKCPRITTHYNSISNVSFKNIYLSDGSVWRTYDKVDQNVASSWYSSDKVFLAVKQQDNVVGQNIYLYNKTLGNCVRVEISCPPSKSDLSYLQYVSCDTKYNQVKMKDGYGLFHYFKIHHNYIDEITGSWSGNDCIVIGENINLETVSGYSDKKYRLKLINTNKLSQVSAERIIYLK